MPIERELKFSLLDPPPGALELESAFRGSPFALVPGGTHTHVDRYYDDERGSLARSHLALRRRSSGASEVAALKTRGTVSGAAHEREELEAPVEGDRWPAGILARVREQVDVADGDALRPRFELATERTSYGVRHEGALVATLAFDEVEARYPDSERSALFREAEIEAADGTSLQTLQAIAERLERLVTLTPSAVTKLQRAEAVLLLGAAL